MKEEAAREEKLKELEEELNSVKADLQNKEDSLHAAKVKERKEIARTMLNNGLNIQQVANCTQLSVEQVTALGKELESGG